MSIHIEIERDPSIRGYSIWITKEKMDGTPQLALPLNLDFKDVILGEPEPPTLQLPRYTADEFLSGFATALATSGFKADELKNVNQQIDAMKYHLEDMRRLVFKNAGSQPK